VVDVKDIGTVAEHEQNRLSLNCFFLYNLSAACVVFFQFGMIVLIVGIDRESYKQAQDQIANSNITQPSTSMASEI
jgi:succinate dehydrogenase hydrophobic anchor subunit